MKPLVLKPEQATAVERISSEATRAALVAAGTGCSWEDCARPHQARGLCSMHWQRAKYRGILEQFSRTDFNNPSQSFAHRTEWRGECLIWTGATHEKGYGRMWDGGKVVPSHQWAWEQEHGPVPEGMHLDHKDHCNPACCNPKHLRLSTVAENVRNRGGLDKNNTSGYRGVSWDKSRGKWSAKVQYKGRTYNLGRFTDKEEAAEVARKKREEFFKEFAGKG